MQALPGLATPCRDPGRETFWRARPRPIPALTHLLEHVGRLCSGKWYMGLEEGLEWAGRAS
jgi:hypothetical protein